MMKKIDKALMVQNYSKSSSTESYKVGQLLTINSIKIKGFKSGQKFRIAGIKDDETLIIDTISTSKIGRDRTRKGVEFNIKENINFVTIFNQNIENPIKIKINDKIKFNKRIFNKDNKNVTIARVGNEGIIKDIEESFLTVELSFGKTIKFNANENNFFEHA